MIANSLRSIGLLSIITVAVFATTGCGGPQQFNAASLDSQEAIDSAAGQYWKKQGWWSMPKDKKTLAITEFSVEYITGSGTQHDGLGVVPLMQMAGVGKKKMVYDEDMKFELSRDLYRIYAQALEARGYTVIAPETVVATAGYQALSAAKDGDTSRQAARSRGSWQRTDYQDGEVYSAAPLVAVKRGFFSNMSNPKHEGSAIIESGAQLGLHVRIRCGVDEKGRATLFAGSVVEVVDVKSWSDVKGADTHYAGPIGSLVSERTLFFSEPIISEKEFQAFKGDVMTVDSAAMKHAVTDVFNTFARLSVARLQK